jgi:hypothetical protein
MMKSTLSLYYACRTCIENGHVQYMGSYGWTEEKAKARAWKTRHGADCYTKVYSSDNHMEKYHYYTEKHTYKLDEITQLPSK